MKKTWSWKSRVKFPLKKNDLVDDYPQQRIVKSEESLTKSFLTLFRIYFLLSAKIAIERTFLFWFKMERITALFRYHIILLHLTPPASTQCGERLRERGDCRFVRFGGRGGWSQIRRQQKAWVSSNVIPLRRIPIHLQHKKYIYTPQNTACPSTIPQTQRVSEQICMLDLLRKWPRPCRK